MLHGLSWVFQRNSIDVPAGFRGFQQRFRGFYVVSRGVIGDVLELQEVSSGFRGFRGVPRFFQGFMSGPRVLEDFRGVPDVFQRISGCLVGRGEGTMGFEKGLRGISEVFKEASRGFRVC